MQTIEEILRSRCKFIGDESWELTGTPQEVIDEINHSIVQTVQELANTTSPNLLLNEIVGYYYTLNSNAKEEA